MRCKQFKQCLVKIVMVVFAFFFFPSFCVLVEVCGLGVSNIHSRNEIIQAIKKTTGLVRNFYRDKGGICSLF